MKPFLNYRRQTGKNLYIYGKSFFGLKSFSIEEIEPLLNLLL